jgi:acyl-CoA thioesterase-2
MDGPPGSSLEKMLTVRSSGATRFEAVLESFWGGADSADLFARAWLAAAASADAPGHHLSASMLGPASPGVPIALELDAPAPGIARVAASSPEGPIAQITLRFGLAAKGDSFQSSFAPTPVPAPEELPSELETARAEGWERYAAGPIEARRVTPYAQVAADEPADWVGWLRPREPLGDDLELHGAALAFLSAYRNHWAIERRLGAAFPSAKLTLLDHAFFVHRAVPWDDFWLVRTGADVGVGGRVLSRREIFARDGSLLASAIWQTQVQLGASPGF